MQSYANTRTTGKEQYYTMSEVVDTCLAEVQKHIDLTDKTILEPCGGTGEFIEGFKRIGIPESRIISMDIEPSHPLVRLGNYFEIDFSGEDSLYRGRSGLISITNPPFGRASSLAKKFFNHAASHSDYICYLVPKAWRKWTVHNSLDKNFHLIADIDMPKNCFYLPDGSTKENNVLNTVFQIWEKRNYPRKKIQVPDHGLITKIIPNYVEVDVVDENGEPVLDDNEEQKTKRTPTTVDGANFEIITFGHSCGNCSDITEASVPYKTTTMYLKIDREDVKQAMRQIDYSKYFNNVSYVQALSIQEINYELNEWFGLDNFLLDK